MNRVVLVLLFVLYGCCINKSSLHFDLYDQESGIQEKINGSKYTYLSEIFIVNDYSNCKVSDIQVDSFINKVRTNSIRDYDYITIYLYKYSKKTNLENWRSNPRDIDRYSNEHDLIFCYVIHDNTERSISKSKYRNGKIIAPKGDIEITDAPPK